MFQAQERKRTEAMFCITVDKSIVKNQLLYTWILLSETFEKFQGGFPQNNEFVNKLYGVTRNPKQIGKIPSSFSTEDLVSNLVNFYAVVEGRTVDSLLKDHAGRFDEDDEKVISRAIWRHSLKPEQGGALIDPWRPQYFDHNEFIGIPLPSGNRHHSYRARQDLMVAQELIPKYHRKFGEPKFPSYFEKYEPNGKGVIKLIRNNGKSNGNW